MKVGDYVVHKGRKAEIIFEKYGLVRIRYLDDSHIIWADPVSLSKI